MSALVYASPLALGQARELLPRGAVLEREVERQILAGNIKVGHDGGLVFGEKKWVAEVTRTPGRLRERPRAWTVVKVRPYEHRGPRNGRSQVNGNG